MPRLLPGRFAPECVREFDQAALERYADAAVLGQSGRRTGAIYLYGYVVEMLLKAAYFRLIGYGDADRIGLVALRDAVGDSPVSAARSLGLTGTRNLHDITAWADLVVAYRASRACPYTDAGFAPTLTTHVSTVHDRWSETIRYHKNVAYRHEVERVAAACEWCVSRRYEI